jgi:hypothetical protein
MLRNKIIDVFFNKVLCDPFSLPYDIMKYIEENLRDSALRAMMQDIMLNCGELEEMAEWQVNLAKGFQVKHGAIEVKGGVAPFDRSSDAREYLVGLRETVCERYHEHTERDQMVAIGEGGWFFDPPLN